MEQVFTWMALYGFNILGAIIILVVGLWFSKLLTKIIRKILTGKEVEPTLVSFTCNLIYAALVAFVVIAAISKLGVQTTSFIAVLGAAGLAIGLALQGSLANFAAGVMILTFRPFKVSDLIEAGGVLGVVEDLHIFTTQIKTADNKTIFIPNGKLTADNITNYTLKGTRRMDLVIGVSYDSDIKKTKQILLDVLRQDSRILPEPEPTVAVLELADSSVNFAVRPWVNVTDYWGVYFDTLEKIKTRLDEEDISIPFPQRDIHLYQTAG